MSRQPYAVIYKNEQWQYTNLTLLRRINTKLATLIPYRKMEYRSHDKQYYINVTSTDPAVHMSTLGPYFINYWIALADYIDMWEVNERAWTPKVVVQRIKGQDRSEERRV